MLSDLPSDCIFAKPSLPKTALQDLILRPIGVYVLSGLATQGDRLLSIDTVRGYLVAIDPRTNNTKVLNPYHIDDWLDATGLALGQDRLWFTRGEVVFYYEGLPPEGGYDSTQLPQRFVELPYEVNGIAVWDNILYITCQKSGYIHLYDSGTGRLLNKLPQPGVGKTSITATEEELWLCDRTEQTVYCLDRTTGSLKFSALTPFSNPAGITLYSPAQPKRKVTKRKTAASTVASPEANATPASLEDSSTGDRICYIVYSDEEPYIRDDPNADSPYQLTFRDRTFIHPLRIYNNPDQRYTLSNGYLIELSYVEELQPLDAITLQNVEWRMALPADTLRQRVRQVEAIGYPFTEVEQEGQRVAVFKFDQLQPFQGGIFGWKAILEMYSLKYYLSPADVEDCPPLAPEFQQRYLVDDDELAMDNPIIQAAAQEAIGTETNVLRKILKIRNYVYDRLSYGIQPRISTPDVALERGVGSCGEYVGIILALARLNGIACRTIGRYKCPPHNDRRYLPLEPDFNHVWLEFYLPGLGWLPMESNVDDVVERGPYPTRFFMGLSWYHTELGKGISFEKLFAPNLPNPFSIQDLAINHIRFRILEEL
ncbi:MAG: transglutaminase-like domain-containing protein [Synechococcales bacterium]|nr:transglutaminase-like domain-containing protein [Synechococcales bacterium]